MTNELDTIGKRIHWLRTAATGRERTLQEVGDACGVSAQAVEQWEKIEGRVPRNDRIEALATFFKVEKAWIMYGGDKPATVVKNPLKMIDAGGTKALPLLEADITFMADETENLALRLLREIRTAQEATDAKLDTFIASTDKKLDKLNIDLIGVKGRVRKVEEAIESIARVMSDGAFG